MKSAASLVALLAPAAVAATGFEPVRDNSLDYLYAQYREADLPAADSASGRRQSRYRVDTHQLDASRKLGADDQLRLGLTHETMSGASPWYVMPDTRGRPVQVMSGASISETRNAADLTWQHAWEAGLRTRLSGGFSEENDYRAAKLGLEHVVDSYDNMRSLAAGISAFDDRLTPTDGGSARFPTRLREASKRGGSLYVGYTQILGPRDQLRATASVLWQEGYLSDPYKLAYLTSTATTTADSRPDKRLSESLLLQYRHALGAPGLALQADYRWFRDDWQINAQTLNLGLQRSGTNWDGSLSLRWYSQSQAYFYAPYYDTARSDALASSDYRLSPYGSLGVRLDVGHRWDSWRLGGGIAVQQSSERYAAGRVLMANPGLVNWVSAYLQLSRHY